MDKFIKIIMFIFVGALVVLIVTHAAGFSTAVQSVGGQVTQDAGLLAGYNTAGGLPNSEGSTGPYIVNGKIYGNP